MLDLQDVRPAVAFDLQYRGRAVFCAVRQAEGTWAPLALVGALIDYRDGTIGVYWPLLGDNPCDLHVYGPGDFRLVAETIDFRR
jgi:hypothetical protein